MLGSGMSNHRCDSVLMQDGCSASPSSDSDMFVWAASIFGPADTPWVSRRAWPGCLIKRGAHLPLGNC
jgi:hypothetical protein